MTGKNLSRGIMALVLLAAGCGTDQGTGLLALSISADSSIAPEAASRVVLSLPGTRNRTHTGSFPPAGGGALVLEFPRLPASDSPVTITVQAFDSSNCLVGAASQPVTIKAGVKTPSDIVLKGTATCGDSGIAAGGDAGPDTALDGPGNRVDGPAIASDAPGRDAAEAGVSNVDAIARLDASMIDGTTDTPQSSSTEAGAIPDSSDASNSTRPEVADAPLGSETGIDVPLGSGGATGTGGITTAGGTTGSGAGGINGTGGITTAGGTTGSGTGGINGSGGIATAGGSTGGGAGGNNGTGGGGSPGTGGASGGATTQDGGIDAPASTGGSATGGATGVDGQPGSGGTTGSTGPCDIYQSASPPTPCVAAHSTVRALYGAYSGALYQLRRVSDSATQDVSVSARGGFVDISAHNSFCPSGTACTISIIYDQSPNQNHLKKSPVTLWLPSGGNEANAAEGQITVSGHVAHGIYVNNDGSIADDAGTPANVAYRINATTGMATGDQPEAMYVVLDGKRYNQWCCFDYGNAETDNKNDGKATVEAIYWGASTQFQKGGDGTGPWVAADLENGMFECDTPGSVCSTNTSIIGWSYVTAMLKGPSGNLFGLKAGNAQSGILQTKWDGPRPPGYSTMNKQGAIILGTGGDGSNYGKGTFFEGAITSGNPTDATDNLVQANIVAAGYGN